MVGGPRNVHCNVKLRQVAETMHHGWRSRAPWSRRLLWM